MFYYERKFRKKGYNIIIGVDEAGRGSLAGPVVAAAVALKTHRFKNRIDDSKKLSPHQREKAFMELERNCVFGLRIVNERVIDRINILQATKIAMEEAVRALLHKLNFPENKPYVMVDGNIKLEIEYPSLNIVKGDTKSKSIASASIIAKVTRDRIMSIYDKVFPEYGFLRHKGYPTLAHKIALANFGRSLIHRRSFSPVRKDLANGKPTFSNDLSSVQG